MQQHPSIEQVGDAIRASRKAAGWTQESFAVHVGLDRGYYGNIERGKLNMSLLVLFRIAAGLKLPPGELLPGLSSLRKLPAPSKTRGRRQAL